MKSSFVLNWSNFSLFKFWQTYVYSNFFPRQTLFLVIFNNHQESGKKPFELNINHMNFCLYLLVVQRNLQYEIFQDALTTSQNKIMTTVWHKTTTPPTIQFVDKTDRENFSFIYGQMVKEKTYTKWFVVVNGIANSIAACRHFNNLFARTISENFF